MAATGTPTPNIGLRIPQGTDPASVDDINYNSNLLDTKLGAVGNTSVQDQIDSLNSNLAKAVLNYLPTMTSEELLKSTLIDFANSVASYEARPFSFYWTGGTNEYIVNGKNYGGHLYVEYNDTNNLYFSVNMSDYEGNFVCIGYANGVWTFNSFRSRLSIKEISSATTILSLIQGSINDSVTEYRILDNVTISDYPSAMTAAGGINVRYVSVRRHNLISYITIYACTTGGIPKTIIGHRTNDSVFWGEVV